MSKTNIALALKGSSAPKEAPKQASPASGLEALWASIPPSAKAVRGGQRYVVVEGSGMRTIEEHSFEVTAAKVDFNALIAMLADDQLESLMGSDMSDLGEAKDMREHIAANIPTYRRGLMAYFDGLDEDDQEKLRASLAAAKVKADAEHQERHQKIVDYFKSKGIDYDALGDDSAAQDALMSEHADAVEGFIKGAKKKEPEPTAIPEINPKQADPRLKDKHTEEANYAELEPGKRPAVVVLNKKGSEGKIYEARSVSDEDLKKNELEYALAQWCPSMGEARRMAKVLEENRQDKVPQPNTWPSTKSPQALSEKEIKALPSGTEKVDRMRRSDVTGRRRVLASQEVKAGSPGWYSDVRKSNKIGDLNRSQTGRQAERLMNVMQQAIDKVAQSEGAEPGEPFMTDRAWMESHKAKLSKEILKRVKPGVDPKVYLVLEDENYHFLNELLDTLGLYGSPQAEASAPVVAGQICKKCGKPASAVDRTHGFCPECNGASVTAAGGEGAAAEGETAGDPDPERKPATQTVTVQLSEEEAAELAKRFGYKLEADSFDDVNHGGYDADDAKKMSLPKKFDGAEQLFPGEVAMAAEDADRDAIAAKIVEASKDALEQALTDIDVSGSDYYDDGLQQSIPTLGAAVTSAVWDGWKLKLTIQDPALLFNWITSGMGYFATELDPYEPMDEAEVKGYLHMLPDYFQIMGDSKPEIRDVDAFPSDEDLAYHLEFRLKESGDVDLPKAAEAILEKVDEDFERPAAGDDAEMEGWFEEVKALAVKVAEWTGLEADAIVKAVETAMKAGQPGGSEDMKKKEAEGQIRLLESRRGGSLLFLKAKGLLSPRAAKGGAQRGLPFLAELSEADEVSPDRIVEALKDIARKYAAGQETMGVLDMYERAAAAVVGADEAARIVKTELDGGDLRRTSQGKPPMHASEVNKFACWYEDGGDTTYLKRRFESTQAAEAWMKVEGFSKKHDDWGIYQPDKSPKKGVNAGAPYQARPMKKGPKFDKTTGFMPREGLYPSGDPVKAVPGNGSSRFKFQKLRRVEGKKAAPARRARFSWDGGAGFEGYDLTPEMGHWNGFDSPGFEKAVADKICRQAKRERKGDKGYDIGYDASKDAYTETDPEYGGTDEPYVVGPSAEVETVDGPKKLYTLGAWVWTWTAVDEEEPVEGSLRAFGKANRAFFMSVWAAIQDDFLKKATTALAAAFEGEIIGEKTDGGWVKAVKVFSHSGSPDGMTTVWLFPNADAQGKPYLSLALSDPTAAGGEGDWPTFYESEGVSPVVEHVAEATGLPVRGSDGDAALKAKALEWPSEGGELSRAKAWQNAALDFLGGGYHPDNSGGDYVSMMSDEPTFTPEEAAKFDDNLRHAHEAFDEFDEDIYEHGLQHPTFKQDDEAAPALKD